MLKKNPKIKMSRTKHFLGVLLILLFNPSIGLINSEKPTDKIENRELLEYLMQASSHAFSQMPPGYLYNSAMSEENQLELPVTSASNLSVINDENDNTTNHQNTNYLNNNHHQVNHHHHINSQLNHQNQNHQMSSHITNQLNHLNNPINHLNPNVSSRSVNLTRFLSNEDDDNNYLINMNKQAKSNDFISSPLNYLHGPSKLYRMTNGRENGWRREPFSARTVSSLFGRPRKTFATANELKSIDLMKSAADIPTASASFYTTEGELEDPTQMSLAAKTAAMRSYPAAMYHQATNYGQYYAEDPRMAHYYSQMRDYYDPHGHDMSAYSKSDFYWLIPIAFLIGAGALLLPIISVFMTTLVTSGTLTLNAGRRRKRDVDFLVGELRHLIGEEAYAKLEDLYLTVQKSIDKFGTKKTN